MLTPPCICRAGVCCVFPTLCIHRPQDDNKAYGQCPHVHGTMMPGTAVRPPARGTYRHGDLRRALLDAGIDLARAGGPDAVVLREATRRAGVVPNAAYRHFADRDELLAAVCAAAM